MNSNEAYFSASFATKALTPSTAVMLNTADPTTKPKPNLEIKKCLCESRNLYLENKQQNIPLSCRILTLFWAPNECHDRRDDLGEAAAQGHQGEAHGVAGQTPL